MTDCLHHMAKAAITTWGEGRRALRALWATVQEAADEWGFSPTMSATVDSEVIRIINICMNHNLMYNVFNEWDLSTWYQSEPTIEPSYRTPTDQKPVSSEPTATS